MSIVCRESAQSSNEVLIEVSGHFDFTEQKAFRDAYLQYPADMSYRVDLSCADYLDSSALGMLLLLRQHAGEQSEKVKLVGASNAVMKILNIANFDKLFTFE